MLLIRILLSSQILDVFLLVEGIVNASENFSHSRFWPSSSCLVLVALSCSKGPPGLASLTVRTHATVDARYA